MKILESNEKYHANKEAIGSSLLKKIASKSVLHALASENKSSAALELGSAIHCAILEPEQFDRQFIASPSFDRRTKEGKLLAEQFESMAQGKTVITKDQLEIVKGILKSLGQHEIAHAMLSGGEAEYSYYAKDEETGLMLKCRPDYFNQNALIDIKSTRDASVSEFTRSCVNLGYQIQAAFYLDVFNKANGTNIEDFFFIAVETEAPYAVNIFKMGEAEIALGRNQYRAALKEYANAKNNPEKIYEFGYKKQINEIVFPMWAFDKWGA